MEAEYLRGEQIGSFVVHKVHMIDELQAVLYELEHEVTGAKVMHLANDDRENLFCLSFQTLPDSDNGAAHILEHTVLCGSKKFPVKDPFFGMQRRSLNTFMNALTGSDFTCYPAASQVEADFYNLLEVYIDAVFHPHLKEMSFLQEGHRLEFEKEDDPTSPLIYKGIVYNEMKGSLASPENRLWHQMLERLMPDTPYGFNSGGTPEAIPSLSYQQLLEFHKTYYNPSRCLYFFYGNLPLENHLQFLQERVFRGKEGAPPLPPIKKQKRFKKPKEVVSTYPTQDEDLTKKSYIGFGWLTCPITEQEDLLGLSLVESLLMDTDASPLKRALLSSGLCVQADGFMDSEMSEVPYMVLCRGCNKEDADKLEEVLKESLEQISMDGFDETLIEAALHQLEFGRLEITGGGSPFGLTLFFRSALMQQHGCPPENGLKFYSLFNALREKLKNSDYLPGLIRSYLLENSHYVKLIMNPDPEEEAKSAEAEAERLERIKASLSEEEQTRLLKRSKELESFQEEAEHQKLDSLPKLTLNDVPKEAISFPLNEEKVGDLTVFHHNCFTNHIVYANLLFDLPDFTYEELPYLALLISIMSEVGVGDRSYIDNLGYIQSYTGGFSASLSMNTQYDDPEKVRPSFSLRGKSLIRHVDKLLPLFKEVLSDLRLDEKERIKELILQIHASIDSRMKRNPLNYAIMTSVAGFSKTGTAKHLLFGLGYYQFIENIVKNIDENIDNTVDKLMKVKERLFHQSAPHLILSCDTEAYQSLAQQNFFGLTSLNGQSFTPWQGSFSPLDIKSHARSMSSPVAFTSLAVKTVSAESGLSPALSTATELLDNIILHKKIREQGGAYGGGSNYNPMTGNFTFYGFRDPHIKSTLDAFLESVKTIAAGEFSSNDIEEALFGLIQSLDSPTPPGSRAIAEYFALREGKTVERRQEYRDGLLALTKEQIQKTLRSELLEKMEGAVSVTFASKELLDKEKISLPILPLSE